MTLLKEFPREEIITILKLSNYWASKNSNKYPENLYKAITTSSILEIINCPCNSTCTCKKFGCTFHIARKCEIDFNDFVDEFLSCYVNKKLHALIKKSIQHPTHSKEQLTGRGKNITPALVEIQKIWPKIKSTPSQKTLICSEPTTLLSVPDFHISSNTIYTAKIQSLLNPDAFIAYDTGSQRLLTRDYERSYKAMIKAVRLDLINFLEQNNQTINCFRNNDKPELFFTEIGRHNMVSLTPIGSIIDKLYLTL